MLARCTACQHTFRTEEFGRQRCPVCGAEVRVEEPIATAYAAAPAGHPPTASEPMATGEAGPIPWERRAELGFFRALGQTLKLALGTPTKLFSSMRYDSMAGAQLFFFLVAVLPQLAGDVVNRVLSASSGAQTDEVMQLLHSAGGGLSLDPRLVQGIEAYERLSNSPSAFAGTLAWDVVSSYLMLFALAGLAHLVLRMLRQARGGFPATLKVFAYSFAPMVLNAVPYLCCSGTIALLWASGLQIVGLRHAHRASNGAALMAVIGWELPFLAAFIVGAVVLMLHLSQLAG